MPRLKTHDETHLAARIGWLRAAVLGANDGIISAASQRFCIALHPFAARESRA
jgi:hypothetical protein